MGALIGVEASEEQGVVVFVLAERDLGHVDAVVDRAQVREVGVGRALEVADGNETHLGREMAEQPAGLVVERTVDGVDDREPP